MVIFELFSRIKFWNNADRLGPDCLTTQFKLYFKKAGKKLCVKKFKHFGEGAEFRPGAYAIACSNISLGANVVIRPTSMLFADTRKDGAQIVIEDDVLIGSGVHIYVNNHRFDDLNIPIIKQGHYVGKNVIIRTGAWIGANAIILPGVTIGQNAVVGAGSIVTKDVPDACVFVGNPAKLIKEI
ncbi:MAG: acyltransferase [Bacteroidales bacterium]|nr:acyltransferase [Bacteroidales bacterium]